MFSQYQNLAPSGCWYLQMHPRGFKKYLPQVGLSTQTTILSTTSRTTLSQVFCNPQKSKKLDEVQYTFPLYDGVSVISFEFTVASRTVHGEIKEKNEARTVYKEAVDRGKMAGLLEQIAEAADVFTTRIGNVPPNENVTVKIVYIGELKHDAETDGSRFTIPTAIAPRYGNLASDLGPLPKNSSSAVADGIRILVDVQVDKGSLIRGLQSPSHPVAMTMGRTSTTPNDKYDANHASATLTLGSTTLDKDFVIVVSATGQDTPRALLETYPSIPGESESQRALMVTLVPKFNLPSILPEIVFIADRSGSMDGKIEALVTAMKIFLKSLPVGVKFNICSFGTQHSFLWPKSRTYDQASLQAALDHLENFQADYGGTEMLEPIRATIENRFKDMPLEVMVITDGEIWSQQELFDYINKCSDGSKPARFFSLGIGSAASSSLVEGIAKAGNGFAQFVMENETMDKRVVRMLKGALSPHINDYTLEVKYDAADDDYDLVERVADSRIVFVEEPKAQSSGPAKKRAISLFDPSAKEEPTNLPTGRYDHLPNIRTPTLIQTPHRIPPLYTCNRTTVYVLINEEKPRTPVSVLLRATSEYGPLELEIPVEDVGYGSTVNRLAARKAIHEIEQGRSWLTDARTKDWELLKERYEGRWDEIVEREAVRLGLRFGVVGKWCSFVAVEADSTLNKENDLQGLRMGRPLPLHQSAGDAFQSIKPSVFGLGQPHNVTWRTAGRAPMASPPHYNVSNYAVAENYPSAALFGQQGNTPMGLFGNQPSSTTRGLFGSSAMMSSSSFAAPAAKKKAVKGGGISARGSGNTNPQPSTPLPPFGGAASAAADSGEEYRSMEGETPDRTDNDRMHALIALQSFDGSWEWNDKLFTTLGIAKEKLEKMLLSSPRFSFRTDTGVGELTWRLRATIAAIAFLEEKMAGESGAWELLVQKAKDWLGAQVKDAGGQVEEEIGRVRKGWISAEH